MVMVWPRSFSRVARLLDGIEQHRLSAGKDHMVDPMPHHMPHDLIQPDHLPFRIPAGIGRIAPDASQVAPAGADKHRRNPHPDPLALNGRKDLADAELGGGHRGSLLAGKRDDGGVGVRWVMEVKGSFTCITFVTSHLHLPKSLPMEHHPT